MASSSTLDKLLAHPLWLAPMAGVTDQAFRTVCLRHGAGLAYTEMISAAGLFYGSPETRALACPAPAEERIAVQLFGSDAVMMAQQAVKLEEELDGRIALIDVNMGCPVRKVAGKGEGAALMKDPARAAEIIRALVSSCKSIITAKFRSGYETGENSAPEFARVLEQAGASLVAVHGRSARQMYRGSADWDIIAQVKEAVSIPVAGSGDVTSYAAAQEMMRTCGVDCVMVARGARGNPWIFEGVCASHEQRIATAREHLGLYISYYGDEHLTPLRSQLAWYFHGVPGAATMRRELSGATSREDFERIFDRAECHLQ